MSPARRLSTPSLLAHVASDSSTQPPWSFRCDAVSGAVLLRTERSRLSCECLLYLNGGLRGSCHHRRSFLSLLWHTRVSFTSSLSVVLEYRAVLCCFPADPSFGPRLSRCLPMRVRTLGLLPLVSAGTQFFFLKHFPVFISFLVVLFFRTPSPSLSFSMAFPC